MAKGKRAIPEPTGRELHDRATRGEALTDAEQATLRDWYDAQDAAENALLLAAPDSSPDTLRADVDAALVRLQDVTQGLQRLNAENATALCWRSSIFFSAC